MINTKAFYDYLLANGLDFFVGVPDSLLSSLCACVKENSPATNNIIAANEGNAVGMASGYHIATGRFPVAYMQNSGLGNTVNPLLSLCDEQVYRVPMLLVIGWRGEPGKKDEPQHAKQGQVTLGLLEAMGIEYKILEDDYEAQIDEICAYMKEFGKPIALVVRAGSFDKYSISKPEDRYVIKREEALENILSTIEADSFIVSTTGKTSREIFEIREARGQGHERDFLTVGSMGHTASIALGMALGSEKNIYCVDGDGSFLMHMGGMGVAALNAPANFKYILINNGAHESVGGQPTIAFDIDVEGVLKAVGFDKVLTATTGEEIVSGIGELKAQARCALVIYVNQGSRADLGRPTVSPEDNKLNMMKAFAGGNRF